MLFENFFSNKTVLVTGHTGFIGSWLTLWLKLLNSNVVGLSIDYPTQPSLFKTLQLEKNIHHYLEDINNIQSIKKILETHSPDIIFHLAAQPLVKESYVSPLSTFQTNVMGTANLLDSLRNSSSVKSCIVMTSDKCYRNIESDYAYVENDSLGGDDPYSASKGAAEIVTQSYKKSFFNENFPNISTIRAGNVIGGGDWASNRIIPDCIRSFSTHSPVILRHPEAIRPFQYVLEPICGMLNLTEKMWSDNSLSDSWNFGPHDVSPSTVKDVVDQIIKNWGSGEWAHTQNPSAFKESQLLMLNSQKALKKLNWKTVFDLNTAISETTLWYKQYFQNPENIISYSENCIVSYAKKIKETIPEM